MEICITKYTAYELFDIEQSDAILGTPEWMNLIFRRKGDRGEDFGGPGIYACFYKNELIYIGKFLGKRENVFSGDVASMRWAKHIASFTLSGRKQSFSSRSLKKIAASKDCFPKQGIGAADSVAMTRDRGIMSTYNRYLFAAQNWNCFQIIYSSDLEEFSFLYVRVSVVDADSHEILRQRISHSEDILVNELRPRCNAVIEPGTHTEGLTSEKVEHHVIGVVSCSLFDGSLDMKECNVSAGNEEPEDISADALFLENVESTSQNGIKLLNKLIKKYGDKSGVEVHFSHVPDLRIRVFGKSSRTGKEVSQNIFRMQWRVRTSRFLCEICTPSNEIPTEFGASDNNHGPLPTQFYLDCSGGGTDAKKLFKVIESAIKAWRSRC
jgi:hypothetical protein